jgi:hypothetical protein
MPCSSCRYCDIVFEKAAVVKKEEVERAAQKVKNFSEKLVSGEIFEIPRFHLLFRFPLFKWLIKRMVRRQLAATSK